VHFPQLSNKGRENMQDRRLPDFCAGNEGADRGEHSEGAGRGERSAGAEEKKATIGTGE
jgi:hypothetical protein